MSTTSRRCAVLIATVLAVGQPLAGASDACEPLLELATSSGPIRIRLHADAAPQAVARIRELTAEDRFDGLLIDYTRPRAELRTGELDPGNALPIQIDARALGLAERRVANRGEAMDVVQNTLVPAYRRALRGGPLHPVLEQWLESWFEDYEPDFLIGTSYQRLYESLGHVYTAGLASRPVVRGSVALVPTGPGVASTRLSIALTDLPPRTGKWMVIGEVVDDLALADRISLAPLDSPPNTRPIGYRPDDPVTIRTAHEECVAGSPERLANLGDPS